MNGFETALGEITLVLFTTLAPSGAVAVALMGLPIVTGWANVEERRRINKFISIPLVLSLVGLVASATHLGNPANALYVIANIGHSPLSNEVACAVAFLGLAGVYWLYSFAERPRRALQRVWMVAIMVAVAVFVTSVAFAYAADTIISWDTPYVPLNLWLNALVGGPVLAVLGLRVAQYGSIAGRLGRAFIILSGVALALNVVGFGSQSIQLPQLQNAFVTAADLVPGYGLMIAAFGVCVMAGIGVDAQALFERHSQKATVNLTVLRTVLASVLVLAGIFVMRFAFYMMHMTVGLGV